jgi:ABC-type phosphate transport system substrate-binding protein
MVSFVKYIVAGALAFGLGLGASPVIADVVAVVSAKSPITALSKSQVTDIFLGKASRFPDGTQAVPIDQIEGTAVRDEFYTNFIGKTAAQMKAHWSKIIFTGRGQPPKVVSNSREIKQLLAQDPRAIGYIERSAVDGSVKVLNPP